MADLLRYGAYDILREDAASDEARRAFCEADIDQLLAQGHKMTHGAPNGGAGGAFSKATFSSEADQVGGGAVDLHDPEFWSKLMPAAAARASSGGGLERAARRRSGANRMVEDDGSEDDEGVRGWKRRREDDPDAEVLRGRVRARVRLRVRVRFKVMVRVDPTPTLNHTRWTPAR